MKKLSALTILIFSLFLSTDAFAECKNEDFSIFFERFKTDIPFSKERTKWPLLLTEQEFNDSSKSKSKHIKSGADFWALKKSIPEFLNENKGIETSISEANQKQVYVTFGIYDADILFDVSFIKKKGCWFLTEITQYER